MRFLFEMSNRERNTWVALAMTLLVSGIYFSEILAVAGGMNDRAAMGDVVIVVIVYGVFCGLILSVLNWWKKKEDKDERDFRFEAIANMKGYSTLFGCGVLLMLFNAINGRYLSSSVFGVVEINSTLNANLLLLSLLAAQLVRILTLLFFYRRGY